MPCRVFMWFLAKLVFVFFMFAMVKAMVPRYRYDQLDAARAGKCSCRLSLLMVVVVAGVLHALQWSRGVSGLAERLSCQRRSTGV